VTNLSASAVAFVAAWLGALLLTPFVARLAVRWGAVDHPDGRRKHQLRAVPRGGGVAIALAALLAVAAVVLMFSPQATSPDGNSSNSWMMHGLLPALLVLVAVGIADDVLSLTGIYKLIGQVLAVSVLVAAGSKFESLSLFAWTIPLGDFGIPFTIFFCLGAINAFNLIDGADGLAASIGAIVCLTLGIITGSRGDVMASLVCLSLAGGLVGFLRYNIPPASVYMGDTGSMLVGLVVAAVAVDSSIKQQAAFALAVPVAICAIPILDAAAALVRRVTTGQSVFAADRGHLHHALLLRGWSVGKTVAFIAGLTSLTCAGALASYFTDNDLFALLVSIGVFGTLALTRIFGHAEAALIASHSRSLMRGIVRRRARGGGGEAENSVQLQGTRKWQKVWTALREAAPRYNVASLTLHVTIPHLHESFHANWKRNDSSAADDAWRIVLPLVFDDRPIGTLSVVGGAGDRQALADMQQFLEFLESLDGEIARIVTEKELAVESWKSAAPASVTN
jgi:UDP-GlcNAc:undecaprenyl-phosphate/decaprenyl-phosphate GlcNAc-1-phosphate transferase